MGYDFRIQNNLIVRRNLLKIFKLPKLEIQYYIGGFQSVDLIITDLKNHMTC